MSTRPRIVILAAVLVLAVPFQRASAQDVAANPTRPSASDNAFLTAHRYLELEAGWLAQRGFWSLPILAKYAPLAKTEIGFLMSGLINHDSAGPDSVTKMGDLGLQVKQQVWRGGRGAAALVGRVEFPASSPVRFTVYATPSFLTPGGQLDSTLGMTIVGSEISGFYAAAFSPGLDLPVGLFAEVFGEFRPGENPVSLDFGVSYPVSSRFVLDASFGLGLNAFAPGWTLQVGFTRVLFRI